MHILRNTGKRIVFHVYNVLFGETSFCKDNKIVNFIILHTKQYIYFSLKQKEYQLFVILYILSSPEPILSSPVVVVVVVNFSHFQPNLAQIFFG